MCLHMFIEVLLHVEVLSTPLAHELLVSDVNAHVGAQLVFVLEAFTAVLKCHTVDTYKSLFRTGGQKFI